MKTRLFTLLLLLFPICLFAQNYEKEGDDLFAQAHYEQAEKKYKAAIAIEDETPAVKQKQDKCSKCKSLLTKAQTAEKESRYNDAAKYYSNLYSIHPLASYQSKANAMKQKAEQADLAQKKERERNYVNDHLAVDMGLSVRWADCNIGANNSHEVGNYYAWGETNSKTSYSWKTYKHLSNDKLLKYCTNADCGRVDSKLVLEPIDDAATANWGEAWSTPTKEQWEELADDRNCRWEWTEKSGIQGYVVTSKITGNSIFLPITGYKPSGTRIEHPELGLYWTSTLYTKKYMDGYLAAYRFDFGSEHYNCRGTHRCNGRAIRAVCK